jgi:hypothetical protein
MPAAEIGFAADHLVDAVNQRARAVKSAAAATPRAR